MSLKWGDSYSWLIEKPEIGLLGLDRSLKASVVHLGLGKWGIRFPNPKYLERQDFAESETQIEQHVLALCCWPCARVAGRVAVFGSALQLS